MSAYEILIQKTVRFLVMILAGLTLSSCSSSPDGSKANGETHWMQQCTNSDACGSGLDCVCGICTTSCDNLQPAECDGAPEASICISDKLKTGLGCVVETMESLCLPSCDGGCSSDSTCTEGACVPNFVLAEPAPERDLATGSNATEDDEDVGGAGENNDDSASSVDSVFERIGSDFYAGRGYKSGSRLKAITVAKKGGSDTGSIFKRFYDTLLQVECAFELTRDDSYRCMPAAHSAYAFQPTDIGIAEKNLPTDLTQSLLNSIYGASDYYQDDNCEGESIGLALTDKVGIFETCPEQSFGKLASTYETIVFDTAPSTNTYYHLDESVEPTACVAGLKPDDIGKTVYDIELNPELSTFVEGVPTIEAFGDNLGVVVLTGTDGSAFVRSLYHPDLGECTAGNIDGDDMVSYQFGDNTEHSCLPIDSLTSSDDYGRFFLTQDCSSEEFDLGATFYGLEQYPFGIPTYARYQDELYTVSNLEAAVTPFYVKNADGECSEYQLGALPGLIFGFHHYLFQRGDIVDSSTFQQLDIRMRRRGGIVEPVVVADDESATYVIPSSLFTIADSDAENSAPDDSALNQTDSDIAPLKTDQCRFYEAKETGEYYCLPAENTEDYVSTSASFSDAACSKQLIRAADDTPPPTIASVLAIPKAHGCKSHWGMSLSIEDIVLVGEPFTGTTYYQWADASQTSCEAQDVSSNHTYYNVKESVLDQVPVFTETRTP